MSSKKRRYNPKPGDCVWTTAIAPGSPMEIEKGATNARVMRKHPRKQGWVEVEYGDYSDRAFVAEDSCVFDKYGPVPNRTEIDNPPVF
jgi:hypothetical protein